MALTVTKNAFTDEKEAFAEIERMGWHAAAMDMVSEDEEFHWHEFDTVVFFVEGTARAMCEDGTIQEASPGCRVDLPARAVHHDIAGYTYRGIFGFSVDPAEMTQPINKPVVG